MTPKPYGSTVIITGKCHSQTKEVDSSIHASEKRVSSHDLSQHEINLQIITRHF